MRRWELGPTGQKPRRPGDGSFAGLTAQLRRGSSISPHFEPSRIQHLSRLLLNTRSDSIQCRRPPLEAPGSCRTARKFRPAGTFESEWITTWLISNHFGHFQDNARTRFPRSEVVGRTGLEPVTPCVSSLSPMEPSDTLWRDLKWDREHPGW